MLKDKTGQKNRFKKKNDLSQLEITSKTCNRSYENRITPYKAN
jgi:hypothetical protein